MKEEGISSEDMQAFRDALVRELDPARFSVSEVREVGIQVVIKKDSPMGRILKRVLKA